MNGSRVGLGGVDSTECATATKMAAKLEAVGAALGHEPYGRDLEEEHTRKVERRGLGKEAETGDGREGREPLLTAHAAAQLSGFGQEGGQPAGATVPWGHQGLQPRVGSLRAPDRGDLTLTLTFTLTLTLIQASVLLNMRVVSPPWVWWRRKRI